MTQPAPIVDIHAHHTPERYKHALRTKGHWYGLDETPGELGRGASTRAWRSASPTWTRSAATCSW